MSAHLEDDPYGVPTGSVPRKLPFANMSGNPSHNLRPVRKENGTYLKSEKMANLLPGSVLYAGLCPHGVTPEHCADCHSTVGANAKQVSGSHYKTMKVQPWDYCWANNLGGIETMVVKYVSRWRAKNGLADLEKAKHCIEKLIELAQEDRSWQEGR